MKGLSLSCEGFSRAKGARVSVPGGRRLFRGEGEGFAAVLDHPAHFADAFGALGRALVTGEDVARTGGARLDGGGDVTLAKTVAVADVHGAGLGSGANGSP